MFNKTKVINDLYGLVGSEQPANPTYAIVDADNLLSTSGRNFTDNPFCKIETFVDNVDYDNADAAQINTDLKTLQTTAITSICDKIFNRSDFIDRQLLYQFANNKQDVDVMPEDSFVGYRITTALNKNTAFKFTRILLEFEGTGDLDLYLFNTAEKNPIETAKITITSSNQSATLNWEVDYTDAYYKGDFFIGYLESEATAEGLTPIKRDYQNANVMTCITFLNFESISVPNVTTAEMFDLDNIDGASESWGLNPDVTVYNDATDLIIQNKFLFAKAVQLQGQINFLSKIVGSIRSNLNERLGKGYTNKILAEIEGITDTNKVGLKAELRQEVTTLIKEIARINNGYFANGFIMNTLT